MCGYLIFAKIDAKKKKSCKCYMDGQRMNMYTFPIYIIHGPFDNIMLSHDLQCNYVGCDFIYAIKTILIVNVGCNYFILTNWHFSSIVCR
jgi:hypothetical protein